MWFSLFGKRRRSRPAKKFCTDILTLECTFLPRFNAVRELSIQSATNSSWTIQGNIFGITDNNAVVVTALTVFQSYVLKGKIILDTGNAKASVVFLLLEISSEFWCLLVPQYALFEFLEGDNPRESWWNGCCLKCLPPEWHWSR